MRFESSLRLFLIFSFAKGKHNISSLDSVSSLNMNCLHNPGLWRFDFRFHLHGFHYQQYMVFSDIVSNSDFNSYNISGSGCWNFYYRCCSCWWRGNKGVFRNWSGRNCSTRADLDLLYMPVHSDGVITSSGCWRCSHRHTRRSFFCSIR